MTNGLTESRLSSIFLLRCPRALFVVAVPEGVAPDVVGGGVVGGGQLLEQFGLQHQEVLLVDGKRRRDGAQQGGGGVSARSPFRPERAIRRGGHSPSRLDSLILQLSAGIAPYCV